MGYSLMGVNVKTERKTSLRLYGGSAETEW